MKAIKKNFENLKKVCDSIVDVSFSEGSFVIRYVLPDSICLFSSGRDGIGSSILSKMIPSNFPYRVRLADDGIYLTIWID